MKHPLLPVALWYAAAIVLAGLVQAPLFPLFAVTLAWGLLGLFWSGARRVLFPAFLFFAGWVNLGWRQAVLSPHDLRDLAGERAQQVTLRGTITGVPSPRVLVRDEAEFWHTLMPVEVSALRVKGGPWRPAVGLVQTTTRGNELTNLFHGLAVEVEGVLAPPPVAVAEGLFDYPLTCANSAFTTS